MTVRGLTLDGSRTPTGSPNNPFPVNFELARWVNVEGNTIRNGDHGAIRFERGTSDSIISNNTLTDHGTPSAKLGAAIWCYQACSDNTAANNTINGDGYMAITADDRTETSSEWDAPSDRNHFVGNVIDLPKYVINAAIFVVGSQGNVVEGNDIRNSTYGIEVARSTQGTVPAPTVRNTVMSNHLFGHDRGLYVWGDNNWIERNELTSVPNPIVDEGVGNQFIENLVVAAPVS
jgi:parallel beta-helix repeat protein